ncbi:bifunctional ADP-dependent NAD(P)H-hydrate dehydratase/NAD(P)H-hydrate epimerase [Sphingomonas jeddahensis]|uniref:Bifunctional NAD(P)H-hydrate repair enzyme n=1 Tax=Sphingomonas jeddahensis TaxID=1915074 RepID=A0A1V2ETU0_9SPHN|nr:bifunctional ADP-dependent NAD(P)H-hydrate dehydratase/NAD(P)H-hydrate epimerase [Sphingomonas jeddahensis]ONF96010.1 Bifunctional NAD(P)H-hydrate repair enzyme Nnr [Sphingomonas jeddahensis]
MIRLDGLPIVTTEQMRAAEAQAIAAGATVDGLMARAGEAVAEQVRRLAAGAEVLVVCGPGNNGGDGYVAAAALKRAGHSVRVACFSEPRTAAAGAARARWTGAIEPLSEAMLAPVLLDAMFGVGLTRELDKGVTGSLRRLIEGARLSIAVDVPSGVSSDDGASLADLPPVDVTLALGAPKPAHVLQPAAQRCGAVRVLDIRVAVEGSVRVAAAPRLTRPVPEAHKYSRGLVAVVGGAMPGAAALTATAAARSGAGYVLLLGSATDRLPHAIVRRRFSAEALGDERVGAVVIGPGLGREDQAKGRLDAALACGRPLVIDGDALHLLDGRKVDGPMIVTPHAGEFTAMFGEIGGSKIEQAHEAARRSGAIVVFKGADTVIAAPDGRVVVQPDGPAWLSTAGTGDVLAGVIGARLAAGGDPFEAAADGAWLHAEAARLAGPAFMADDLAAHLPVAIGRCL